jgi:peroxiredoxin
MISGNVEGGSMLKAGDKAPVFQAQSAFGREVDLEGLLKEGPVVLIFLRFVGCPLSRMRLAGLAEDQARFQARGAKLLVVLESSAERVRKYISKRSMSGMFVPDPERRLFDLYQVRPGNLGQMFHPLTVAATVKATLKGHMHGAFEGNTLQLPADFVIGADGILKLARYGAHQADNATTDELLKVL